jgi:hypothetical protein
MNEEQKNKIDRILKTLVFLLSGFFSSFFAGMIMSSVGAEPWTVVYVLVFLFILILFYQGLTLFFSFVFGKFDWCYSYQVKIFNKAVVIVEQIKSKLQ